LPSRIYDSFALLKLFQQEQGYRKVARLLEEDRKGKNQPLIQIINFGEIIYRTKKDFGQDAKLRVIRTVIQLGLRIISASDDLVYEAAELKRKLCDIVRRRLSPGYSFTRRRRDSDRRSRIRKG
jgi:PIN domain nuclease of toxin-antitoxin system